ncbi:hypothetical protein M885DRAFT_499590 [Pelagophyceae sp. CCMP2097]|nr:hypothetical protein M885DRAFT_499590 [Pelagophyceae sp. CCMP2097]
MAAATTAAFLESLNDPGVQTFKRDFAELVAAGATTSANVSSLQSKLDEAAAELASVRDVVVATTRSREEVAAHKKSVAQAVEDGAFKLAVLQNAETSIRAKVEDLYASNALLEASLLKGSGWSSEQLLLKKTAGDDVDLVQRNLESQNMQILALRGDVAALQAHVEAGESGLAESEAKVADFGRQCDAQRGRLRAEASLEQAARGSLEQRLQYLQGEMEKEVCTLARRETRAKAEDAAIAATEAQLRDSKKEMEKLFQETQRLTEQLESLMHSNEAIESENDVRRKYVSSRESSISTLKQEQHDLGLAKAAVHSKIARMEATHEAAEAHRFWPRLGASRAVFEFAIRGRQRGWSAVERGPGRRCASCVVDRVGESLKARVDSLNTFEFRAAARAGDLKRTQLDDLSREREILSRKLGTSEKTAALIFDLTKVNENAKKNLQNEVSGFTSSVKTQRQQIEQLVRDREAHERDGENAARKYYVALERLKLQEVQIADVQRSAPASVSEFRQSNLQVQGTARTETRVDATFWGKHFGHGH